MTIKVTPNPDGSYTVKCNGVEVVVGRDRATDHDPDRDGEEDPDTGADAGPIIWPKDPDQNDGGVYAYLFVGPPAGLRGPTTRAADTRPRLMLQSPDTLIRAIQKELRGPWTRVPDHRHCMCVMLEAMPEQVLDLDAILEPLKPIAERAGLRIELHIQVAVPVGMSSG